MKKGKNENINIVCQIKLYYLICNYINYKFKMKKPN